MPPKVSRRWVAAIPTSLCPDSQSWQFLISPET